VQAVREVFDRGNEFCQKITYKTTGAKPEDLIQSFRNSYHPRIAVTVDMIATGTDIKPLEVLLFMRMVKSQGFFDQMKGRGTRTISDTDFQSVTKDARSKTHFVLVDAVGVCEQFKTDVPPLERKRSVPFAKLLDALAMGVRDDDTLSSLAGRLGRLAPHLTPQEAQTITEAAGGKTIRELAQGLVAALDPDRRLQVAQTATGQAEPDDAAIRAAAEQLTLQAALPFDNPDLREALKAAQRRDEQVIDPQQDQVTFAGADPQARLVAERVAASFRQYIEQHRDEITALQVLYSRPRHAPLQWNDLKQLAVAIEAPPLSLTTDTLWQAYRQLDQDRVRGASGQRVLTDLVALVRYALERDRDPQAVLEPYGELVRQRFEAWLAVQEQRRGKPFSPEQRQWLELIRDHVATSVEVTRASLDEYPFFQRGGLGMAWDLFGAELDTILQQANEGLAA
jgi:type I restriction enzyme R subunit